MKTICKFLMPYALCLMPCVAQCASVIASVNGAPITDRDITARVKLMNIQGDSGTDNRLRALSNIIDDNIKLGFAAQIQINPSDAEVKKEIDNMKSRGFDVSGLDSVGMEMLRFATKSHIAWQMIIGRTIMPAVNVTDRDIKDEIAELSRSRGLPIDVTLVRLADIPESVAEKLTPAKDCDTAEKIAWNLGGAPTRITAPEFELSVETRGRIADLPLLAWSSRGPDRSVLLVCKRQKMKEYGELDDIIKQNAVFKRAMFIGDQQLKQLRRKAVIVINDQNYKGAI
ncbi:MAG: SurA N-terminal domain-containing protein [Alphaproteobacteria bacterium]|nr:SurA N-terminal domain-containing protein [Alphaproteobacteria bacterium]